MRCESDRMCAQSALKLRSFSDIFLKEDNFCHFLFTFQHINTFKKWVYSLGSKFFPFRIDPFSERDKVRFDCVVCFERVFIPLKVIYTVHAIKLKMHVRSSNYHCLLTHVLLNKLRYQAHF